MSMLKRIMRSDPGHAFMCWLVANYVRFVRLTNIWKVEGTGHRDRLVAEGKSFVIVLWHSRIAMMPYAFSHKTRQITIVASDHRDGRLVVEGLGSFGFKAIMLGDETTAKGTRDAVRILKKGEYIGFTPDGPRGPRQRAKQGAVVIASLAGVPIVPVAYAQSKRKLLRSWDKFNFPLPFARGVCLWGEPIEVPRRADADALDAIRLQVEQTLNEMTDECDRRMGQDPIPPAPEDAPVKA